MRLIALRVWCCCIVRLKRVIEDSSLVLRVRRRVVVPCPPCEGSIFDWKPILEYWAPAVLAAVFSYYILLIVFRESTPILSPDKLPFPLLLRFRLLLWLSSTAESNFCADSFLSLTVVNVWLHKLKLCRLFDLGRVVKGDCELVFGSTTDTLHNSPLL